MESASCNFSWPTKCAVWPTKLQSVWPFGYSCLILTLCSLFQNPTCSATRDAYTRIRASSSYLLQKLLHSLFKNKKGILFHHSEFKLNFRKMRLLTLQIPKSVRHMFIKGTQFRELRKKVLQLSTVTSSIKALAFALLSS